MPVYEAPSTSTGDATGYGVADAYGKKTETAGTEITRVAPPRPGTRTRVRGLQYKAAATAHTVTMLTALSEVSNSTDAESGQTVLVLASVPTIPTDGSLLAAGDWLVVRHESGSWVPYKVSSISGLSVTLTANLGGKVLEGSQVFFMGAPGDHTNRQYAVAASETFGIACGEGSMLAAGSKNNSPVLVLSDNATNAGEMRWVAWDYAVV